MPEQELKPIVHESILVSLQCGDKYKHVVAPLQPVGTRQIGNSVELVLEIGDALKDVVFADDGIVSITDDPTSTRASDYVSLGHARLKFVLKRARIDVVEDLTIFTMDKKDFGQHLLVQER